MSTQLNKRLAYFQDNFVDDLSEDDVDLSQYYYKRDQQGKSSSSSPAPSNSSGSWSQTLSQDMHPSNVAYGQYRSQQRAQPSPQLSGTGAGVAQAGSAIDDDDGGNRQEYRYANSQESTSSTKRANGMMHSIGGASTSLPERSGNAFNDSMAKAWSARQRQQNAHQSDASSREMQNGDAVLPTATTTSGGGGGSSSGQVRSPTIYQNSHHQQQHVLGQHIPQQEYYPSETILSMLNGGNTSSNVGANQAAQQRYLLLQQQQQQQQQRAFASKPMGADASHAVGMTSIPPPPQQQQQYQQVHPSSQIPPFQQHQSFQQNYLGNNNQIHMQQQQLYQQQQQQQQHHLQMKRKAQKPTTEDDRYGLLGLMSVINMTDDDTSTLAIGYDLTGLGLNLNSSDSLYSNFASPWSDGPSRIPPQFKVPECYISRPQAKDSSYMQIFTKFGEETLFYIFYTMPKDISQIIAAKQLSARGWRYHKELKMWFTQVPGTQLLQKTATMESGSYMYFDINTWKLERKDGIVLRYDDLLEGI